MTVNIKATSATSVVRPVDDLWRISVFVCQSTPALAPVFTVTSPSGADAVPAATGPSAAGCWYVDVDLALPGRYVAHVVHETAGALDFTAYAGTYVPAAGMPDRESLSIYMGDHSFDDDTLQDALDAEAAAQRASIRMPAVYGADLANALKRRAQRNLFMRRLPLALPSGDGDTGPQYIPGRDPEVRRLEAPYRKMATG